MIYMNDEVCARRPYRFEASRWQSSQGYPTVNEWTPGYRLPIANMPAYGREKTPNYLLVASVRSNFMKATVVVVHLPLHSSQQRNVSHTYRFT